MRERSLWNTNQHLVTEKLSSTHSPFSLPFQKTSESQIRSNPGFHSPWELARGFRRIKRRTVKSGRPSRLAA